MDTRNNSPFEDDLFNQMATITKAHAYDVVNDHRKELIKQNNNFRHSLNMVLDEIMTLNPDEFIKSPAALLRRIGNICNETLRDNKPS
jgi:hypothetical protein